MYWSKSDNYDLITRNINLIDEIVNMKINVAVIIFKGGFFFLPAIIPG